MSSPPNVGRKTGWLRSHLHIALRILVNRRTLLITIQVVSLLARLEMVLRRFFGNF